LFWETGGGLRLKQKLDAGRIVNTHGIQGEVKVDPWCDSPAFLCQFDTVYLDSQAVKVLHARVHKNHVLLTLEGVADVNAAMRLKGRVIQIDRADAHLPEGRHFIADLIGVDALDADSGEKLGTVVDVLTPPAHEVYVIQSEPFPEGERLVYAEYLIPAVDAFLIESCPEEGYVKVRPIDGMRTVIACVPH